MSENISTNYSPNTLPPDYQQKPSQNWRGLLSSLKFIVAVVFLVLLINTFGLQSYQVFGQSMHPTLEHGDRLIISKLGKTTASLLRRDYLPKRGDIVVFEDPYLSDRQLIKRIIALPGERVLLEEGVLTVFNDEHPEGFNPDVDYATDLVFTVGMVDVTIPESQVFVMGDNRGPNGSLDSRNELGTIPTDLLVGSLMVRLFPVTQFKVF